MDPSIQLFFDEIRRMFDEADARWDRRVSKFRAVLDQRSASGDFRVHIPERIPAAQSDVVVVADNWGGLFDGDDLPIAAGQIRTDTLLHADVPIAPSAARDAVSLSDGPCITVPLGRHDSRGPTSSIAVLTLPPPSTTADELTSAFGATDLVALSVGAHTVGKARCSSFGNIAGSVITGSELFSADEDASELLLARLFRLAARADAEVPASSAPAASTPWRTSTTTPCNTILVSSGNEHARTHPIIAKDDTTSITPARCSTHVPPPTHAPVTNSLAARATEEEIRTNSPSRCSTKCLIRDIDVLKPMDNVRSAPPMSFYLMAIIPPDINKDCSLEHSQRRYITTSTPSLSSDVALLCVPTNIHDAHKVFEGMSTQNHLLLESFPTTVVDIRPWPPPQQHCNILPSETIQLCFTLWAPFIRIWVTMQQSPSGLPFNRTHVIYTGWFFSLRRKPWQFQAYSIEPNLITRSAGMVCTRKLHLLWALENMQGHGGLLCHVLIKTQYKLERVPNYTCWLFDPAGPFFKLPKILHDAVLGFRHIAVVPCAQLLQHYKFGASLTREVGAYCKDINNMQAVAVNSSSYVLGNMWDHTVLVTVSFPCVLLLHDWDDFFLADSHQFTSTCSAVHIKLSWFQCWPYGIVQTLLDICDYEYFSTAFHVTRPSHIQSFNCLTNFGKVENCCVPMADSTKQISQFLVLGNNGNHIPSLSLQFGALSVVFLAMSEHQYGCEVTTVWPSQRHLAIILLMANINILWHLVMISVRKIDFHTIVGSGNSNTIGAAQLDQHFCGASCNLFALECLFTAGLVMMLMSTGVQFYWYSQSVDYVTHKPTTGSSQNMPYMPHCLSNWHWFSYAAIEPWILFEVVHIDLYNCSVRSITFLRSINYLPTSWDPG